MSKYCLIFVVSMIKKLTHMSKNTNHTIARLVAKELNLPLGKRLGQGSCGTAFNLGKDRVVKITYQEQEYYKSTELIGKKSKHLCEIYETYVVNYEDKTRYAIVQERLSTKIEDTLRNLENLTDVHYFAQKLVKCANRDTINNFKELKNSHNKYRHLIEQYRKIAVECRLYNFGNADILRCNIGQRKGSDDLVMFDFGYASNYSKPNRETSFNFTPDWVEEKIQLVAHRGRQLGIYLQNIV